MWRRNQNNWNNPRHDDRGSGGPVLRDPLSQQNRTLPYKLTNNKVHANVDSAGNGNPFEFQQEDFNNTPFSPGMFPRAGGDFPPNGKQFEVQDFNNAPFPSHNDGTFPPPPQPASLMNLNLSHEFSFPNFNEPPPSIPAADTTSSSFSFDANSFREPPPFFAGNLANVAAASSESPFNNYETFPRPDDNRPGGGLMPTPLLPSPGLQPGRTSSPAVYTNDEQPPFAFPNRSRENTQVMRNPKAGLNIGSKLLSLAGINTSVDDSNSSLPPPAQSFNGPSNPEDWTGWAENPTPKKDLLPNPLFREKTNSGIPSWLRGDDNAGVGEQPHRFQSNFETKPKNQGFKKKQGFDWKRSSFLKELSGPANNNNHQNNQWNQNKATNFSPATGNNPHPKSCIRNPSNGQNVGPNSDQKRNLEPLIQKTPLLPTPKLIPYPPPPLPPPVQRAPKGILKPVSSYNNFVKEGDISNDSYDDSAPVVPYDDDDDDIEFIGETTKQESSKSSDNSHDFFSEKMVKSFASLLEGKSIEVQLEELLTYLILPPDFLSTRVSIVRNLHIMISETFKKCAIHPYGADFIGFGNSDDSVNVFVDLNGKHGASSNVENSNIAPSDLTKENVEELMKLIQESKNHKFFGQIVRRTNFNFYRRNLPVISFIHSDTQVRCNIRMDNYLLVQEAKVIQFVCALDTRIPPLMGLIRYWSSFHKVLDTPEEDTKNRFITLLMLFFLAHKKIIPTMAHLQSLSVKREYFENMDISFCDDFSLIPKNESPELEDRAVYTLSTLSLLKQFFVMFAKAKFDEDVVSLWKAEFIPKENFSPDVEGKVLPPDLRKRYRYGADGKLRDKRLDCGSLLCIQDFQDLTENLSLAVAQYEVSKFQIEAEVAHKKMDEIMMGSGSLTDLFVPTVYADETPAKVGTFLERATQNTD